MMTRIPLLIIVASGSATCPMLLYTGPEFRISDSCQQTQNIVDQKLLTHAYTRFEPTVAWYDDFESTVLMLTDDVVEEVDEVVAALLRKNYSLKKFIDRVRDTMVLVGDVYETLLSVMDVEYEGTDRRAEALLVLGASGLTECQNELILDNFFFSIDPDSELVTDLFDVMDSGIVPPIHEVRERILRDQKHRAFGLIHGAEMERRVLPGQLRSNLFQWFSPTHLPEPDIAESIVGILGDWQRSPKTAVDVLDLDTYVFTTNWTVDDELLDWLQRIQGMFVVPLEVFQFMIAINQGGQEQPIDALLEEKVAQYNHASSGHTLALEYANVYNWYMCYTRQFAGAPIEDIPYELFQKTYVIPPMSVVHELVVHLAIDLEDRM